jgi:hypothetical protein
MNKVRRTQVMLLCIVLLLFGQLDGMPFGTLELTNALSYVCVSPESCIAKTDGATRCTVLATSVTAFADSTAAAKTALEAVSVQMEHDANENTFVNATILNVSYLGSSITEEPQIARNGGGTAATGANVVALTKSPKAMILIAAMAAVAVTAAAIGMYAVQKRLRGDAADDESHLKETSSTVNGGCNSLDSHAHSVDLA